MDLSMLIAILKRLPVSLRKKFLRAFVDVLLERAVDEKTL